MENINLNDFLEFKFISNLQSSPSQTQMAFLVAKADEKKNEYSYDLFLSDGKKHQKLTNLKNKGSFIWESDQSILFPYAKTKKEEKAVKELKQTLYYRYNLIDRKIEKAYEFNFGVSIINVLNEQKLLLSASLTENQHHLYQDDEESRKKFLEEEKKRALYEDINEIPFYFNGLGFTANLRTQLFIYDIETKVIAPIVNPNFSAGIVKVSDDKKHIYYTGQEITGVKKLTTQVFAYHVTSRTSETLYAENDFSVAKIYLLKDEIVLAGTDMKDFGINQNDDFYILRNNKLELINLYRGSIGNSVGADVRLGGSPADLTQDGKIYFVSTVDDHNELNSIDLLGNIRLEYQFNGSMDGIALVSGQFYAVGLYRQKLQEIYHLDLKNNKLEQRTRLNQFALKNKYVAVPKELVFRSEKHLVKGWVLYPKNFDVTQKYPAILDIHGGPKTVYGKVYYHEMQYWANQGYIVFFANPRGSDGKGDAFSDIRGKYGTIDYDDLMNFTDLVIKKVPQIETEKLFVTGGSYGGFMTNWIVGHTNRFKAAATQRSISNWLSFHGTSDIGFYFSKDQTGGHPNINTDQLWEQSPMKYAMQIETPLLFIHSDMDYRCPIEQAMQLFTILKEKGNETKMIWFKGETHELSRSGKPQARVKRLTEITEWFNQYK
ncbi:MAG: S9 family peptidase [Firmicutes bacterium]|nr:S9 family peptidase [Bacillota bacterium]